jgi:glycosyltransferase involved in cell wall biosynthesis
MNTPMPRLLYVVAEDWYFLSHRLPMARAAKAAGFEVHVATRLAGGEAAIAAEGFVPHALSLRRGSLSPIDLLRASIQLRALLAAVRPAILHNVALKPILAGGLAALSHPGVAVVDSLTGQGAVFADDSRASRLSRPLIAKLLGWLLGRASCVVVQNQDDRAFVAALGASPARISLIPGSGVDTAHFTPLPEPPVPPVTVAYVGRMLAVKGVPLLIDAVSDLRKQGTPLLLLLAGRCDPENPGSLAPQQLREFADAFGIQWLGHVEDVREVWAKAHIAVLASRGGEGLPKTLLEAAACGRPMVATDVPGSRDIVQDGETGILVPTGDRAALAAALKKLADDPELRRKFGANARALVEREFTGERIGREIVALYRSLLTQDG